jgi:lipopolysaccharide/colanic/teichoic acid biosynthesis glycosyltransferase
MGESAQSFSDNGTAMTASVEAGTATRRLPVQLQAGQLLEYSLPWLSSWDTERTRRIVNVVAAAVGLVLTMPVMILVALAIKLTSPGPVIYRQTRVGLDRRNPFDGMGNSRRKVDHGGRLFTVYKFRTMICDGSERQVWACPDDPRLTRIGAFLRRYRIDELPQFYNVLRGDMNIVGPRPEQPEIFAKLREQIDGYTARQRVLPGITGWAQVNHHYDRSVEDVRHKLRYDLEYTDRLSVTEDLRIMARTVPTVLLKKGAW